MKLKGSCPQNQPKPKGIKRPSETVKFDDGILLVDFVRSIGQEEAAKLIGASQGNISLALKKGRDVRIIEYEDGTVSAYELKPYPNFKKGKS